MNLLSLDPGLVHPAIAVFRNGRLVLATRIKPPAGVSASTNLGERILRVASACATLAHTQCSRFDDVVFEWPQVYRAAKSKGDPNDLTPLAGICGALVGLVDYWTRSVSNGTANLRVTSYTPADWIGQVAKATNGDPLESPRGSRIWSRLSPDERDAVVVSHDSLDAAGVGLHHLGRLGVRRVLTSS